MSTAANGRAAVLTGNSKPAKMPVAADKLPPELLSLDRWVGWIWKWDQTKNSGAGKWDKPPMNCRGGHGSSTDPSTWCDVSMALAAAEANEVDGVGIALGDLGDGRRLTGVDLDDCRNPETGELSADTEAIIRKLGIYFEVSPSGTGVKGLCLGEKPRGKCKTGRFEVFSAGKYFTCTGAALPGCPRRLVQATPQIEWFHRSFIAPPKVSETLPEGKSAADTEMIVEALNALDPTRADSYEDWLLVGMALHAADPSLLEEWDRWSAQSSKYAPGVCHDKWLSFNGSGVGVGSLIHWAKEDGWKPTANPHRRKITYRVITCAELASGDYSVEFLIDNALAAGQPLIIAGAQKTLKTSFIVDAAISLATAGHFLGRLPVNRACKVAVMTGESGMGSIQETAHNVCRVAGKWLADIGNLVWTEDLPKFGDIAHLEATEEMLTDNEVEVLAIDPAYLCMPSVDAGNLMAQGELLRNMADLCRRLGVTMMLCHHTKKNTGRDPYEPPELSDIAWSGFSEFARQWWLIGRREKYVPGTGDHKLWLSIGGSAGHSALWAVDVRQGLRTDPDGRRWEVCVQPPHEARESANDERDRLRQQKAAETLTLDKAAACRELAKHPGGMTRTAVRDIAWIGRRIDGVLQALLEDGSIESCDVFTGNQKTPKQGYRLKVSDDA